MITKEDLENYIIAEKKVSDACKEIINFLIEKLKPAEEFWEYAYMSYNEKHITFSIRNNHHMIEDWDIPIEWLWTEEWKVKFETKEVVEVE